MSNPQIHNEIPRSMPGGSKLFSQRMAALQQPRVRMIGGAEFVEASPSHVLDKPLCWDVNGFYRRLGVPTDATKSQIRQAYLDLDGSSSSALTKAVEVLTSKKTRPLYDSMPFGWFWPDDEALIKMLMDNDFESPGEDGWSFYIDDEGSYMFEILGADAAIAHLDEWRCAIALSMWEIGFGKRFCMGAGEEIAVAHVGYRIVCFVPLTIKSTTNYAAQVAAVAERLGTPTP
jgi:hypothetical protein